MNIKEINELLSTNNANIKKHFGQNFLLDQNVLTKIIDSADIENQNVIEIGPGLGALTERLLARAKKVVSYEIDNDMVAILKKRLDCSNLTIVNQDFLKANLKTDMQTYFNSEDVILVANLPYYITTPILLKVLEETSTVKKMVVMIQKEVAQRFIGKPSTKDYNSLSVLIQYLTDVKVVMDVAPSCFYPQPDVYSTVLLIERKALCYPETLNFEYFVKFNRFIFTQRRKTIYNNIKAAYAFSKEQIEEVLLENNILPNARAESLSVEQIVKLANSFYQKK